MLPIVLVDDASEDLVFAERVFAECKILNPLICLKGGQQCLDYFERLGPRDASPCIALIDLVMPQPNGVEVLRRLGSSRHAHATVFVMLSGLADIKLIQQGYQHGARTFLVKPLLRDDVLRLFDAVKGITITRQRDGYELNFDSPEKHLPSEAPRRSDDGSIWLSS